MKNSTQTIAITVSVLCWLILMTNSTSAAKLVPGSIPQTAPLQPLPSDIAPNASNNIDVISNPSNVQQVDQTSRESSAPVDSEDAPIADSATNSAANPDTGFGLWHWLGVVAGCIFVAVAIMLWRKTHPQNAKS